MSVFFESPDEPAATPKRRRTWLPILFTSLAGVLVLSVVAALVYVASIDQAVNTGLRRVSLMPPDSPPVPSERPRPTKPGEDHSLNVVLLGTDDASGGSSRSDALMLLHLSGDRRSAYVISFPRDMYVKIPGHGKNKINAAYAFGGAALTIRTLEDLLGARVDHVAQVDFAGFIQLTDQLGGVEVYNSYPSVSGNYRFPIGKITIRGAEALAYVRQRKELPRGDLDRAGRHRAVIQAILAKGLSGDTISNPAKFLAFTGAAARSVTVDDELDSGEVRKIALSLRLGPADIESLEAPISGFGTSPDGQSIDIVDTARLKELAAALREDRLGDYVAEQPR